MTLTVGSLCSGIGGIDLGLERAGMRVIWQAEIDRYASAVLARHWPGVPNHGDITTMDWRNCERPDLVCAGYPCQPYSVAGRRQGTADPRNLWPAVAECLRVLRPRWGLFENVPGHLRSGFDRVLADLARLGFDAEWQLLSAAAMGAPHLRRRLVIVAYPRSRPLRLQPGRGDPRRAGQAIPGNDGPTRPVAHPAGVGRVGRPTGRGTGRDPAVGDETGGDPGHGGETVADTDRRRRSIVGASQRAGQQSPPGDQSDRRGALRHLELEGEVADPGEFRLARPVFAGPAPQRRGLRPDPARSGWWDVEPDVGRVAAGIPHRVDRLRVLGNAVVPQMAEWVGRRIVAADAEATR